MAEHINIDSPKIQLLNFDIINERITVIIRKFSDEKFYIKDQYCGLIQANNKAILVTRKCDIIYPQIEVLDNPEITFQLVVLKELHDSIQTKSDITIAVSLNDLLNFRTGESISIKKFMGDGFNSSFDINQKMSHLLKYINTPTKYQLI